MSDVEKAYRALDNAGPSAFDDPNVRDAFEFLKLAVAEVRASVVSEEPDWEYGLADEGAIEPYSDVSEDRDWILDGVHPLDEGTVLLRRRKAGPWLPVVAESTNHEKEQP